MIAGSVALQYGMKIYNNSASGSSNEVENNVDSKDTKSTSDTKTKASYTSSTTTNENSADAFINSWLARTFYEGGFEDKMTRREAGIYCRIYALNMNE